MEGRHYGYKKGLWNMEEDKILMDYVKEHGIGKWNRIPKLTGLKRSGKSCRLRWMNYLSPNVKRGDFSKEEEDLIIRLHNLLGNRWSLIAGRTDNQVKNYWNTHLSKNKKNKKKKQLGIIVNNNNKEEKTKVVIGGAPPIPKAMNGMSDGDEDEKEVVVQQARSSRETSDNDDEVITITGHDSGNTFNWWFADTSTTALALSTANYFTHYLQQNYFFDL